jgi:hypothetical protein
MYFWYQYITRAKYWTSLFWNLKKSIEEKKANNIEKYVEKKLHIKIKNKWEKNKMKTSIHRDSNL